MSTSTSIMWNDRPHPGLLPHPPPLRFGAMQERQKHLKSHRIARDWICRTAFQESKSGCSLFLLPGGEGQCEGERQH